MKPVDYMHTLISLLTFEADWMFQERSIASVQPCLKRTHFALEDCGENYLTLSTLIRSWRPFSKPRPASTSMSQ